MELNAAPRRYGVWLAWGTRLGLALLALGFIAYATGAVDAHVPIERLPELWTRPAPDVLREIGLRPGWGWAELLHRSDMLVVAGIGILASCSIPCLAAVIPVFARRRERAFVAICVLQVAVLVLAASGLLAAAH
jgi:hypothetical protein